jgi:hypothetical protein
MEQRLPACEKKVDQSIADLVVVVSIPAWENNDIDQLLDLQHQLVSSYDSTLCTNQLVLPHNSLRSRHIENDNNSIKLEKSSINILPLHFSLFRHAFTGGDLFFPTVNFDFESR